MYEVKIYIVQKVDGEIVGAKLTRGAAQSIARYYAPCRVLTLTADKEPLAATPDQAARYQ